MHDLQTIAARAGFRRRPGANQAAIARTEAAFGVQLPDGFPELWAYSDGMDGDGIELLPLSAVAEYAPIFAGGFGYVPFADCNDSNPYAVCCREPLQGVVVHVFHDDEAQLVCRGLPRFLELVAEARQGDAGVGRIAGDLAFDHPNRTVEDIAAARELVRAVEEMAPGEQWRGDALRFAAQLFGPGQEDELATVLALGDEYTREAVRRRWNGLGTPEAQNRLGEDAVAYRNFLAKLEQAFETAGLQTEPTDHGEFLLQPGNVGLNFAMLFADSRRPGAMEEWVQRFKARVGGQ
jgi:hypothetical protein